MGNGFDRFLDGVWFAILILILLYGLLLAAGVEIRFGLPQ